MGGTCLSCAGWPAAAAAPGRWRASGWSPGSSRGAQTSDRVSRMLESLSILPAKTRSNPKKGEKHKATLEREAAKAGGSIADDSPPDNKVSKESQGNVSDDPGKSDQVKEEGNEKENLAQSADQEPSKADDISDKKQQADSNGVTTEDDKESK